MILKVFTQPNCPKCPAAKELVRRLKTENQKLKIKEYDITTVDGLAEASFYTVMSTPGLILGDEQGKEIMGWRGETPGIEEIKSFLK